MRTTAEAVITPSRGGRGRAAGARRSGVVLLTALLAAGLAGCVGGGGDDVEQTAGAPAPSGSAPATSAPSTEAAVLVPGGSAADNQPFFDQVNRALIASNPDAGGVEITSNLRDNGFDIAAMQVTVDTTTVGVEADSVQFSVKWGDDCLIGQYGRGEYASMVAPALGTGACLIGQTRPIDW
ncbi:hypothetical protein [Herbiconiux sp. A18JL235]|uniref:DUF6993 domain-containing protein n=1 Tax=Herbiconiux sp. A18JL235 TaxID=3152363 RepID=A0AB39BD48_9MICO